MADSYNELVDVTRTASLVLYYPLQETTGTTASDESGNGNDGTIVGMGSNPNTGLGPNDWLPSAFDFDGTDDSVDRAISNIPTVYTMTVFCNADLIPPTIKSIISLGDSSTNDRHASLHNRYLTDFFGHTRFHDVGTDIAETTSAPSVASAWRHVAGVRSSASSQQTYVDGTSVGTSGFTTSAYTSLDRFCVGKNARLAGGQGFDGRIAGVGLWTSALTVSDIGELIDGPEPLNTVAPAAPTGTLTIGSILTAQLGTWDDRDNGSLTYTYQWVRADDASGTNAADIGSATSSTYTLQVADDAKHIACRVLASNDGGSDSDEDTLSAYTANAVGSASNSSLLSIEKPFADPNSFGFGF